MKRVNLKGILMDNDSADIMRWWGWLDITCPLDISTALADAAGDDVTIYVNSPGGNYVAGGEIYGMLRAYEGKTEAIIQSHSASAATVATSGCDIISAEPPAIICVHNPSTTTEGGVQDHLRAAENLGNIKESAINAYMRRSKLSREDLSALMEKDIWINPQQALEYGLIDKIIDGDTLGTPAPMILNSAGIYCPMPTPEMRRLYQEHVAAENMNNDKAKRTQALLDVLAL